jgi:hypothetical protein
MKTSGWILGLADLWKHGKRTAAQFALAGKMTAKNARAVLREGERRGYVAVDRTSKPYTYSLS